MHTTELHTSLATAVHPRCSTTFRLTAANLSALGMMLQFLWISSMFMESYLLIYQRLLIQLITHFCYSNLSMTQISTVAQFSSNIITDTKGKLALQQHCCVCAANKGHSIPPSFPGMAYSLGMQLTASKHCHLWATIETAHRLQLEKQLFQILTLFHQFWTLSGLPKIQLECGNIAQYLALLFL